MNDRYLCRAKRIDNGEWVEGNRIDDGVTGQVFIHAAGNSVNESDKVCEEGCLRFVAFEVDQSSICQCTGAPDKNGKLVFEHDVVRHGEEIYEVAWTDCNVAFELTQFGCSMYSFETIAVSECEVIGSAIDNPELLEVGE